MYNLMSLDSKNIIITGGHLWNRAGNNDRNQ